MDGQINSLFQKSLLLGSFRRCIKTLQAKSLARQSVSFILDVIKRRLGQSNSYDGKKLMFDLTPANWSKTLQNLSKVGVELEKHLLSPIYCKLSSYITIYRFIMFCTNARPPSGILVCTNPVPPGQDPLQNAGVSRGDVRAWNRLMH